MSEGFVNKGKGQHPGMGIEGIDPLNYLLAPGYFHDLAVRLADGAPVARPLLDDDEPAASLVDIVVDRYRNCVTPDYAR